MNLPMVPKPGAPITLDAVVAMEAQVSSAIMAVDDIETLKEWRSQAMALETYLHGKALSGPMRAAQRKVEARIGQLLGDASACVGGRGKSVPCAEQISRVDRQRFRILARGLEQGLPDEEWRRGRDALIAVIQERFPMARRVSASITETGQVRKPRSERVREIADRAEQGMNAAQIAADIGLSEESVRAIASSEGVALADFAIGKVRRPDAVRILTETINGVDAYVSGLSMLDGADLPPLATNDRNDLMQALSRSINGLKKLRNKMEKAYARSDATAA